MNFDQLNRMNFDGAPLLVIPYKSRHLWMGMMSPYDEEIHDDIDPYDVEEIDGKEYFLNDEMDLDNPQTHYDHICNTLEKQKKTHLIYTVQDTECLVFDAFGDGFSWWDEEKILINGRHDANIHELQWGEGIEYSVNDSELILMNSAIHGADPELMEDENWYQRVSLDKGVYRIEKAVGDNIRIFRFHRIKR